MQKYNAQETGYLCSMSSVYAYEKECLPRECYGNPVLLPFADRMYYAPADYDRCLHSLYGDYMQLPPVEEREKSFEIYLRWEIE